MEPCSEEGLQAYHDGESSAEERGRVESHLAACPACALGLARWREAGEAARRLWAARPTESFARGVLARLPREEEGRGLLWAGAFACAASLALGLFFSGEEPSPSAVLLADSRLEAPDIPSPDSASEDMLAFVLEER